MLSRNNKEIKQDLNVYGVLFLILTGILFQHNVYLWPVGLFGALLCGVGLGYIILQEID